MASPDCPSCSSHSSLLATLRRSQARFHLSTSDCVFLVRPSPGACATGFPTFFRSLPSRPVLSWTTCFKLHPASHPHHFQFPFQLHFSLALNILQLFFFFTDLSYLLFFYPTRIYGQSGQEFLVWPWPVWLSWLEHGPLT